MTKKLIILSFLFGALTFISCSSSAKKISPEDSKQTESTTTISSNLNKAEKIISKYENLGIVLTDAQKSQISDLIKKTDATALNRTEKKDILQNIRTNINQKVLTSEQRLKLKK
jgi:PBP1b-binding outer membrane lipoprotein LpoB